MNLQWKRAIRKFLFLLFLLASIYVLIVYYGYIFSTTIEGRVLGLRSLEGGSTFIVAIRQIDALTYTMKTQDSQWGLVEPGRCVRARILPYPPWNLKHSGSYHGAILLNLKDCLPGELEGPEEMLDSSPAIVENKKGEVYGPLLENK